MVIVVDDAVGDDFDADSGGGADIVAAAVAAEDLTSH